MKEKRHIEDYISVAALAIMLAITFINAFSRRFAGVSWSFTEEITTNAFILISVLGTAMAARVGGHLGLTLLQDIVPKKYEKIFHIIILAVVTLLCIMMIVYGSQVVMQEIKSQQTSPALGWPEWIFGTMIPIGGVVILIRFWQAKLKILRQRGDS